MLSIVSPWSFCLPFVGSWIHWLFPFCIKAVNGVRTFKGPAQHQSHFRYLYSVLLERESSHDPHEHKPSSGYRKSTLIRKATYLFDGFAAISWIIDAAPRKIHHTSVQHAISLRFLLLLDTDLNIHYPCKSPLFRKPSSKHPYVGTATPTAIETHLKYHPNRPLYSWSYSMLTCADDQNVIGCPMLNQPNLVTSSNLKQSIDLFPVLENTHDLLLYPEIMADVWYSWMSPQLAIGVLHTNGHYAGKMQLK